MVAVVVGDIGGTNSRLQLLTILPETVTVIKSAEYPSNSFLNFSSILIHFLQDTQAQLGVFAIAGVVSDNTATAVNQRWTPAQFSTSSLESEFHFNKVFFINDFEAAEYGCLVLNTEDYTQLNPSVQPTPHSRKVVIGPGTGLGEAILTWSENKYIAWPSEGGHSDFAPHTEEEWKFAKFMQNLVKTTEEYSQFQPYESVSYEMCCAGRGSYHLYDFFKQEYPEMVNQEFDQLWNAHPDERIKNMMDFGFGKKDLLCQKSVDFWLRFLGYECGNLIAKNLPLGGLYLIGGLVFRNFDRIVEEKEVFFQALRQKPRHICEVIEKVPIFLVKNENVGIIGIVEYAKRMVVEGNWS